MTWTRRLLPLLAGPAIACSPAGATTIAQALQRTLGDNPTITAADANLDAADDDVEIQRTQGRPTLSANGYYDEFLRRSDNDSTAPRRLFSVGVQAALPIYQGGQVRNAIRAADQRASVSRAQLQSARFQTLLAAVTVYMDAVTNQTILELYERQADLLRGYVDFARAGFKAGDLTRTDIAQSQTRLQISLAAVERARGQVDAANEAYLRVVGEAPTALFPPGAVSGLPAGPEQAVDVAMANNPDLAAAKAAVQAAAYDVRAVEGTRAPRLSAFGNAAYSNYLDTLGGTSTLLFRQTERSAVVGMQVTVPLYQGGLPAARVRRAEALRSAAYEDATGTERAVITQVRSAYAQYAGASRSVGQSIDAVAAAEEAVKGMRTEPRAGTRQVIDLLIAQQDLLNAQIGLANARRDAYVYGFTVLALTGTATPDHLGLDGVTVPDPAARYRSSRGRLSDFGGGRKTPPRARGVRNVAMPHAVPYGPELPRP